MTTAEKWMVGVHGAGTLAVVVLCGFVAWTSYSIKNDIRHGETQTTASTVKAMRAVRKVVKQNGARLDAVLKGGDRVLKDGDALVVQGTATLAPIERQARQNGQDVDAELKAVKATTAAATKAIRDLSPAEKHLATMILSANAVIGNPAIPKLLASSAELATQAAGVASDTHKVTHHIEQKIDHPGPHHWWSPRLWWNLLTQTAQLAHDL